MNENKIDVTEAMRVANTTRATMISWCMKYTVGGLPLGVKVGGRWVVYSDRLAKFLAGESELKEGRGNAVEDRS